MLSDDIPLFASLSVAARTAIDASLETVEFQAGAVILEPGVRGAWLYAVAQGSVAIAAQGHSAVSRIVMGRGEIFGEISLLSGSTVSAIVTALDCTTCYRLPEAIFARLFAEDAGFRQGIANLLAQRLRFRTSSLSKSPICAFVVAQSAASPAIAAIQRAVSPYAHVRALPQDGNGHDIPVQLGRQIDAWRATAREDEVCFISSQPSRLSEVVAHCRPGDILLRIDDGAGPTNHLSATAQMPLDEVTIRVGPAAARLSHSEEEWGFRLLSDDITRGLDYPANTSSPCPVLDRIARWITKRNLGITLGAGAARGFAHIGVLQVLDEAGIAVDCLSGSSIGGIVALLYAVCPPGKGATDVARLTLGAATQLQELGVLSRTVWARGRRLRRIAEAFCGDKTFADLPRPVVAAAVDLISGDRVILNKGRVAPALVATSAIPGLLAPMRTANQWLVDGALASRIPVDLLRRWRCGLRIAVNVESAIGPHDPQHQQQLRRSMSGPFGFTRVLGRSWEILGLRQGAAEAKEADIIISPKVSSLFAYDFGAVEQFIRAGREEAREQLPEITRALNTLKQPVGQR
jgi:NTE family protein